jgi:hypothetical protein
MKLQGIDPIGLLGTGLIWPGIAQALLNLERIPMTKPAVLFTKVFLFRRAFEN